MENNNLYVNAEELLELIECMQIATSDCREYRAFEETINIILDLKWIEIKDELGDVEG